MYFVLPLENMTHLYFSLKQLGPLGARSKFCGVSGSEDRGGGDNSIQFINIEGWMTKVLKNGDEK